MGVMSQDGLQLLTPPPPRQVFPGWIHVTIVVYILELSLKYLK
jgi:hypothetical protein